VLAASVVVLSACAARAPSANPSARPPAGAAAASGAQPACGPQRPELCEAACFGGDGHACAVYGQAVEGVADAPVRLKTDRPRGLAALTFGCARGDLDACTLVQDYHSDGGPAANADACDGWLALCARGGQRACVFGGDCLMWAPGYLRDVERAAALFRAACAKNEGIGCREQAFLVEDGKYADADPTAAFSLMQRACSLDDPLACAHLGRYYERGIGTRADTDRARGLYRASCARGIKNLPCQALERLGEVPPRVEER
jgi:TPR repeat protein